MYVCVCMCMYVCVCVHTKVRGLSSESLTGVGIMLLLPDGQSQLLALHIEDVVRYSNVIVYNATHCNTLQHTATHCNTLQHTATHQVRRGSRLPCCPAH